LSPQQSESFSEVNLAAAFPSAAELFGHNIDLGLRINTLKVGDNIEFKGEYSYNPKGGVVYWTHLDPRNQHEAGWIKHNGITYQ
jgi:hypothetical protein